MADIEIRILGWRFVWAAHQYQLSTEEETEETVESNVAGQYEIAEPFGFGE
jgi:Tfp pilus assembly protein PilO